jgi:hypothetical protein
MTLSRLDPTRILETSRRLEARVKERFPDRGLAQIATEIVALTERITAETLVLTQPIWALRLLTGAIVLAGTAVFIWVGSLVPLNQFGREAIASVQTIEAAINTALLAALGLVALVRLEARIKRRRVARGLHELRSVIHVIDMHQLTKDPVTLSPGYVPTAASPEHDLTAPQLLRYLDYASELLAVTGKLAALYAQAVPDEGVADAVNDIEMLGSNLSRKVWQKIMIVETAMARVEPGPPAAPRRTKVAKYPPDLPQSGIA